RPPAGPGRRALGPPGRGLGPRRVRRPAPGRPRPRRRLPGRHPRPRRPPVRRPGPAPGRRPAHRAVAMRICRFVDTREEGAELGGGAWAGAGGARRGVRVGYLDGEVVVPVAGGDGRAGLEAVLDLAMAANADPGLRPPPHADPAPLAPR